MREVKLSAEDCFKLCPEALESKSYSEFAFILHHELVIAMGKAFPGAAVIRPNDDEIFRNLAMTKKGTMLL